VYNITITVRGREMARFRLTYLDALHHVTSRSIEGIKIFSNRHLKIMLLDILSEEIRRFKIDLYAYCIMDNHYHLVLQNNNMRMSDCMRNINGRFARMYRGLHGGNGYIFGDRFYSTVIQNWVYMRNALVYVLRNPKRAGIVQDSFEYEYSSINAYFSNSSNRFLNRRIVEKLFSTKSEFIYTINNSINEQYSEKLCKYGSYVGNEKMEKQIELMFDRRKKTTNIYPNMRDGIFLSQKEVEHLFEKKFKILIQDIDVHTAKGKELRSYLLVMLKNVSGMAYKDINKLPIFRDLKYKSLAKRYQMYKNRIGKTYSGEEVKH